MNSVNAKPVKGWKVENTNIERLDLLTTPQQIKHQLPLSGQAKSTVLNSRLTIQNILNSKDERLIVISGPCSIHDIDSAKEYALKLYRLHQQLNDKLFIIMRVYFEKPRTNVGWKGLINDPDLDGSNNINLGLRKARSLLLWLAELGLPVATEALDPITPQYISDLISWSAIGARTTESQTHREMASGLSMPVGFKNSTDGSLDSATNAILAASSPHSFIGIDNSGQTALLHTRGNPNCHIILRGGAKPNYDSRSVAQCVDKLQQKQLNTAVIIDCSHGNSNKDHNNQPKVMQEVVKQVITGNQHIKGVMLESHLKEGNQPLAAKLIYGQSITDSCIGWEVTEKLLKATYDSLI
ncbi:3-deoxy-7-phosphoheptulonate synthase [Kangiella sp.]|uniref:3-deoxy-7-phosphoheptulonate synthase n=1 Tax=Kangiella sp. TaxID=1920245 RepID=UPI0019B2F160|nr:3-deoxy-7-phosphoheptulonate synthase [Kangiella sp.]MBD3652758.1 3-deoxy-7-phosphoheptulonate synthase [Kangiella sp.]